MLYVEFLKWVGKQGLKSKVLQKYLDKAWQETTKGGKVILKTHFPKLLGKAKEYHEGFKRAGLKVVPKAVKTKPSKTITDKSGKVFEAVVIGPDKHILRPKIIQFPKPFKKPPRKPKADGGSIDKSLPGRSRDI